MKTYDISPEGYRVADFLKWQRDETLDLTPPFQRRSVWKQDAKSYFIDTVIRGLPVPLVFLRERLDVETQEMIREVVDGQQRLRTLFSFIDERTVADFDPERDRFVVKESHNSEVSGQTFSKLPKAIQSRILKYKFSVEILPAEMEDREILQVFARLNSTGYQLNKQELRNAKYFGEFKSLMYSLAYEQFERWLDWEVLTEDQLSRMREVELTSDLVMNMIWGLSGKTQPALNRIYDDFDTKFGGKSEAGRRFRRVMDTIDDQAGDLIPETIFRSEIHFFTLFVYLYDRMWGLESTLTKRSPRSLPRGFRSRLLKVHDRFDRERVPKSVLDAVRRASTDLGRRRTRVDFISSILDGKTS